MKLYRGLKTEEYQELTEDILKEYKKGWEQVLTIRESGDLNYPEQLNEIILNLFQQQPLTKQYFTDNKNVAESYLESGGLVMEIEVPIEDIIKYFLIEFQKFAQRKKFFEIVYMVTGEELAKNSQKWSLKILK